MIIPQHYTSFHCHQQCTNYHHHPISYFLTSVFFFVSLRITILMWVRWNLTTNFLFCLLLFCFILAASQEPQKEGNTRQRFKSLGSLKEWAIFIFTTLFTSCLTGARNPIANRAWANHILSPLSDFFLWHFSALALHQKPFLLGFILCLKFSTVMEPHLGQSLCPRKEFQTIWTQQFWFALPHIWLRMLNTFVYLGEVIFTFLSTDKTLTLTHLLLWLVVL